MVWVGLQYRRVVSCITSPLSVALAATGRQSRCLHAGLRALEQVPIPHTLPPNILHSKHQITLTRQIIITHKIQLWQLVHVFAMAASGLRQHTPGVRNLPHRVLHDNRQRMVPHPIYPFPRRVETHSLFWNHVLHHQQCPCGGKKGVFIQ